MTAIVAQLRKAVALLEKGVGGGGAGRPRGLCGSCVGCWGGERTPGAHEGGGANSIFLVAGVDGVIGGAEAHCEGKVLVGGVIGLPASTGAAAGNRKG